MVISGIKPLCCAGIAGWPPITDSLLPRRAWCCGFDLLRVILLRKGLTDAQQLALLLPQIWFAQPLAGWKKVEDYILID